MLKSACKVVALVWAGCMVIGGLSSGCWAGAAVGLAVIFALC